MQVPMPKTAKSYSPHPLWGWCRWTSAHRDTTIPHHCTLWLTEAVPHVPDGGSNRGSHIPIPAGTEVSQHHSAAPGEPSWLIPKSLTSGHGGSPRSVRVGTHLARILLRLAGEKFSSCSDSWVRKATARWK